jgi:hypothetical protein
MRDGAIGFDFQSSTTSPRKRRMRSAARRIGAAFYGRVKT